MAKLTRSMVNAYAETVAGGSIPSGLFMRDVDSFIEQVRRSDTPMIDLIRSKGTKKKIEFEYGESDLAPREDAVNAPGGVSATATTIPVDDGNKYQQYDLVRNRRTGEQFWLPDEPQGNLLVNVVRDHPDRSGTGIAMNDNDVLEILGPAVPEGANAPASPVYRGTVYVTYPQIFEYTWTMTNRGRHTPNYESRTDQFKYELKRKMKEAAEDLDSLLLFGKKSKGDGDGDNPSTMGGLIEATTTFRKDMSAAPLEFIDILTLMQQSYKEVGLDAIGKTIMGGPFVKRVWNSWYQASRRSNVSDAKYKVTWDEVDTDFGTLKFVVNYKMPDDMLIFWNPDDCGLYNFVNGQWSTGLYSTQGWYDTGFLRGDYGAVFEADRRRGMWHKFSTSESDYDFLDLPAFYALAPSN